jgi:hypothetical protein
MLNILCCPNPDTNLVFVFRKIRRLCDKGAKSLPVRY